MSWRETAREVIGGVLEAIEAEGGEWTTPKGEKATRRALREVYPFGQRKHWPYKIWLDEIRRQLGKPDNRGARTARGKLAEWERIYGKRPA